jgi:hypothetical protein
MSFWDGAQWVGERPPARKPSRLVRRAAAATLEASLVTALTFGLIAGTALAARGGNGGGGNGGGGGKGDAGSATIVLAPLVYDANGNGLPNHGDVVEFTISTTIATPSVNLVCSQGGGVVLNGWKAYYDGSLNSNGYFGLASGVWQGGDAECTAYLKQQTRKGWSTLASTSFHVDG